MKERNLHYVVANKVKSPFKKETISLPPNLDSPYTRSTNDMGTYRKKPIIIPVITLEKTTSTSDKNTEVQIKLILLKINITLALCLQQDDLMKNIEAKVALITKMVALLEEGYKL